MEGGGVRRRYGSSWEDRAALNKWRMDFSCHLGTNVCRSGLETEKFCDFFNFDAIPMIANFVRRDPSVSDGRLDANANPPCNVDGQILSSGFSGHSGTRKQQQQYRDNVD